MGNVSDSIVLEPSTTGERGTVKVRSGIYESDYLTVTNMELSGNAIWYIGANSTNTNSIGFFDGDKPEVEGKQVYCKVFDLEGQLQNVWAENIIAFGGVTTEAEKAGGSCRLTLLRNNEDLLDDIQHLFNVEVYVRDQQSPDGQVVFKGEISNIDRDYKRDTVVVTMTGQGKELSHFILESADASIYERIDQTAPYYRSAADSLCIIVPFDTTGGLATLSRLQMKLGGFFANTPTTITGVFEIYTSEAAAKDRSGAIAETSFTLKDVDIYDIPFVSSYSKGWVRPKLDFGLTSRSPRQSPVYRSFH